jgi:GNAT superfamily N-acetyltransferase
MRPRPVSAQSDLAQLTLLRNSEKLFPRLPNAFMHAVELAPYSVPREVVLLEHGGRVAGAAGYAGAEGEPGLFFMAVIVNPEFRRRGLGREAYSWLLHRVGARGARRLLTKIYAGQSVGLRFAARLGFREIGGSINSQLNVAVASTDGWPDASALVESQSLTLAPLERLPREDLAGRLLPLWNASRPDEPQYWPFLPYDVARLERELLAPVDISLRHSFALLRSDGEVVALNLNAQDAESRLFTVYTGVHPAYRKRRLGLALKLHLIDHAKRNSVAFLAAENEASNRAIWGINRAFGFRRLLELVVYEKRLDAEHAPRTNGGNDARR